MSDADLTARAEAIRLFGEKLEALGRAPPAPELAGHADLIGGILIGLAIGVPLGAALLFALFLHWS